jgi:hypothetical protein
LPEQRWLHLPGKRYTLLNPNSKCCLDYCQ